MRIVSIINSNNNSSSLPAFLLQLILQLHLAVELLLQLVDPFLQVLQLNRKTTTTNSQQFLRDTNRIVPLLYFKASLSQVVATLLT